MAPFDLAHLQAVHRMLLGSLMKTKLFTYSSTITSIVVKGIRRKRGKAGFTRARVAIALGQLIDAALVKKFHHPLPSSPQARHIEELYWLADRDELVKGVDHVKLTLEGWTIAARLNLDRIYR